MVYSMRFIKQLLAVFLDNSGFFLKFHLFKSVTKFCNLTKLTLAAIFLNRPPINPSPAG